MRLRRLTVNLATFGLACAPLPVFPQESSEPGTASSLERTMTERPAVMPTSASAGVFEGKVSYYGADFAGRRTSSGERYLPDRLTMAHKTLRFGTQVRVTNLRNNLSVVVRVNDRGPYAAGRVADVSAAAARLLGMTSAGVVPARLEVLGHAEALATE